MMKSEEMESTALSSEGEGSEGNPVGTVDKPKKKRRKRKGQVGSVRKYHWKKATDPFMNDTASQSDTSVSTSSVMDIGVVEMNSACERSLNEPHICSESDRFSGTTSEFYSDATKSGVEEAQDDCSQSTKLKKRRKKKIRFGCSETMSQNKRSLNILDGENENESSSDEDEGNLELSGSDLSIPDDLSLDSDGCEKNICGESEKDGENSSAAFGQEVSAGEPPTKDSSAVECSEPVFEDSAAFLSDLATTLKLLLPEDWSVDSVEGQIMRIIHVNSSKNAAIDQSVYYAREDSGVGVFVHGLPVPRENNVFKCQNLPDSKSVKSLADYFSELVSRVKMHTVCEGIQNYEELWDLSTGFLDYSSSLDSPYFRDKNCSILMKGSAYYVCHDCQMLMKKLERQKNREDPSKTPDKHLSKDGIILKKNKYKQMATKEKKRADRLQKQVDELKIKLDAALKDELSSILRENQHKMSSLQRTFWLAQFEALGTDDKRGMRWHPMLVRLALHIHSLSPGAYQFLNNVKVLCLPSERRLFDYSHFIEAQEGCQKEITENIKEKIEKCGPDKHFKFVNLMLDEMHIRSGLLVKRSTGELVGYTKLDGVDEELRKIQHELDSKVYKPKLAKKVLVYMARGITSHTVKDVIAVYTTDDLSVTPYMGSGIPFGRFWN